MVVFLLALKYNLGGSESILGGFQLSHFQAENLPRHLSLRPVVKVPA
jgi:hypothetical protein